MLTVPTNATRAQTGARVQFLPNAPTELHTMVAKINSAALNESAEERYRVDSLNSFIRLSSVLNNGSEMRQTISDAEYLLQLDIVVDDDDVALSTVGNVMARLRGIRQIYAGAVAAVHVKKQANNSHSLANLHE
jgi:hypothetical protein